MNACNVIYLLVAGTNGVWFAAAAGDHIEGTEAEADSITCYQCGQPEIDPESDYPASYCDTTISNNCKKDSKMYNLTCDIMDIISSLHYISGYFDWTFMLRKCSKIVIVILYFGV